MTHNCATHLKQSYVISLCLALAALTGILLLAGCSNKYEIAFETGEAVEARIVAEPNGSDYWRAILYVENKKDNVCLLKMLVNGGSDHPIPPGFVAMVLFEDQQRVDLIVNVGEDYFSVPVNYSTRYQSLGTWKDVFGASRIDRQKAPNYYTSKIELFEKEMSRQTERAVTGK